MYNEKQKVAFSSVIAAIFLTVVKILVGLVTGSLGVLSEAAHSALDLGAAIVTMFAVRLSDKPADRDHHYGHGKIESFSALIETLLLLATCGWIIYEAVEMLFLGKPISVDGTWWGVGVMLLSIIINISRARALKKVAKKYGSQALEADALHFDSDVWSSIVVIVGLVCVWVGKHFNIPILDYGDPIAALGVSALVITVSIQLGKRTIDTLLDTAPKGAETTIIRAVNTVNGVLDIKNVRVRSSGPSYFIDLNVGICRNESHSVVHSIVEEIRKKIKESFNGADIVIGTFPVNQPVLGDEDEYGIIRSIVEKFDLCTNIHNINIYEVSGKKYVAVHLELKESLSLKKSHRLSHEIEDRVKEQLKKVEDVSVNFQYVKRKHIMAEDVTDRRQDILDQVNELVNKMPDKLNCHDIKIYEQGGKLSMFLHCGLFEDEYSIEDIESISKEISNEIKNNIKNIESVHIHVEPMSE